MLLWMEMQKYSCSFWYQNEEYKEEEWKKVIILLWTHLKSN